MRIPLALVALLLIASCSDDSPVADAGGGAISDASRIDSGADDASSADGSITADATAVADAIARTSLVPQFCPSVATSPGLYMGSLGLNLNDISGVTGCGSLPASGRDGSVRIELEPGQTVSATYRHDGDGVLYILDSCPVTSSCLDGSDVSVSGAEQVSFTNNTGATNPIYVVLDSNSISGDQTFELDLVVVP